MDDFTVNVRQIGNYPASSAAGLHDLLLIQQNGLGGAYASITPADLVSTALLNNLPLRLHPAAPIQWNGANLRFDGAGFAFSHPLAAPSLLTPSLNATAATVGGEPVATQPFVTAGLDNLVFVSHFNGRAGAVVLERDDILRAGGAPIWDPHFGGHVTVPTPWNPLANDDTAASTAFVQAAICQQLMGGHIVLSYNGRSGNIMPIADDVTAALSAPGVYGLANTPPIGDVSKRIANTSFVDQSLAFFQTEIQDFLTNIAAQLDQSFAPLDSPQFVGIPTAPTAAQTVNSGQLATCAFVKAAVAAATTGVASFNGRTGAVVLTAADVSAVGGALLAGPAFTGTPTAPTAAPGDASTKLATCAFVNAAITGFNAGVTSFNTRVGAVVLTAADVTSVGAALLASPAFSGTPTAPTAAAATNTTQLATCAFVTSAIAALPTAVASFNGRTGAITFQASDISAVGGALLASPVLTGTPTGPTAATITNTTQLATCAFVKAVVAGQAAGVTAFNTRTGAVTLTAADLTAAGGALLAGPTFSGLPAAPTASPGTNSTQLATCAFVTAAVAAASAGVLSFNARTGAVTLQGSDISAAGGALTASPALTGNPTAPTPSPGDNDSSIATTGFVAQALAASGGVISFNGRAGAVTLNSADITGAGGAVLLSPAFTGNPTAPTPALGDNDSSIATAAFVMANAVKLIGDTMTGNLTAPSFVAATSATIGSYYFGNSGTKYLSYDGVNFTLTGAALVVNNALFAATGANVGTYYFGTSASKYLNFDGSNFNLSGGPFHTYGADNTPQWVMHNTTTGYTKTLRITTNDLQIVNSANTAVIMSLGDGGELYANSFNSPSATMVLAPTGAGTIYFRPNGAANASGQATFDSGGNLTVSAVLFSQGNRCRQGIVGAYGANVSNLYYAGGPTQLWIDSTSFGNITTSSDYRVKKDVIELPWMWDTVKKLRPIKYTQADYAPLFQADDIERWGFVAHELQDSLIADAASGVKDAPDHIQSPNPWTLLAALTKTLQEAMVRIEALEGR